MFIITFPHFGVVVGKGQKGPRGPKGPKGPKDPKDPA